MRDIKSDPELAFLEQRVLHYAHNVYKRQLPEMRFFILDPMEFASLLIKRVYPVSPPSIWEGKEMVNTRNRIESGQESSLYYEVVQCGNPSYAYLNETNDACMQASVMAHVVGHCEFSKLNIMADSDDDRTEKVIYLTQRVNRLRQGMGQVNYRSYWNACESVIPLISPNSQYNLENSIETDDSRSTETREERIKNQPLLNSLPFSSTIQSILEPDLKRAERQVKLEKKRISKRENLSRRGYKLKAPCQDIFGFLREYAAKSEGEEAIMDYLYFVNSKQDFIMKTQIMNEGWAMTWEKKIMMDLFAEKSCKGIIDYCKVFSGVCYPRPWFQRNPYHLGFYMWEHIAEDFKKGKISSDFTEEIDRETRLSWDKPPVMEPLQFMEKIVSSCTDYEFLRRYLTEEMIDKFHLNRIDKRMAKKIGVTADDVMREDRRFVWLRTDDIKEQMLGFFTHFHRPRVYLIDCNFLDGGLLLYHRNDGRDLRKNWIRPTLKNINHIWRGTVSLLTKDSLCTWANGSYTEIKAAAPDFDTIRERMLNGEKPFKAER